MSGYQTSNTTPDTMTTPARTRYGHLVGGLAVIGIGLAFLAGNLGFELPFARWHNGWAVFVLLGAVPSLARAVDRFRSVGTVDGYVVRCLTSAAMVVTVAVILLVGAAFEVWWPVFVILGGLSMLAGGGRRRRDWAWDR